MYKPFKLRFSFKSVHHSLSVNLSLAKSSRQHVSTANPLQDWFTLFFILYLFPIRTRLFYLWLICLFIYVAATYTLDEFVTIDDFNVQLDNPIDHFLSS